MVFGLTLPEGREPAGVGFQPALSWESSRRPRPVASLHIYLRPLPSQPHGHKIRPILNSPFSLFSLRKNPMNSRWEQINRIYDAALEVAEEERPVFLERNCQGDEELRREVESLLAYDKPA